MLSGKLGKRRSHVTSGAEQFRQRAALCERMPSQAKDFDAKICFAEAAAEWRELARVTEALDRERRDPS